MNTREQFGKYLLLKKLTEDPLGETFRAGMLGESGMERVVLLRVFNGQGVDGQRLWQATADRAGVQGLLRNPNIGEGVSMGEIEGIPYVAYDYISGKNTATLLEQAARQQNFVPAEHALLITERSALALSAASENRHKGERVLHGFLCPHLIMISNEGETRLLGFEVSPGLRGFSANPVIRQHFGRYLAPEALQGAPPHASDDIYSLGVILFELLTGRPLPPPAQDGFASVIDRGILATEETPIPEDLRNLLKRSLVSRDQRISDVASWHKTLSSWMFEGQYSPTTFNLAFFMHNLFRQEIELENQEIEVEKTLPLPVQRPTAAPSGAVAAPSAPVAVAPGEGTDVREATRAGDEKTENFIPEYAKEDKGSKTGMMIGIAAVAAIAIALVLFFVLGGNKEDQQAATQPPVTAPPPPQPVAEPEPTGPSEEEILAQINEMIAKRASEMEEELRKDYDQQLNELNQQLSDARREAEERKQRELELAEAQAKAEEEARLAAEQAAAEAEAEAAEAAIAEADEGEEGEGGDAESQVAEAQTPPPSVVPPPPVAPPPAVTTPQVRRGDLVEPGPGVSMPELVRRPNPRFPEMARRLNRSGATVMIRALIDENGQVIKAELAGKKAGFGFDDEALSAVRKSTYKAATKDNVPVKIWHTVVVEFRSQ